MASFPQNHFGDRLSRGTYLTIERQELRERLEAQRAAKPKKAPTPAEALANLRSVAREGAGIGREVRPEVREERLRTTAGLRGSPARALSAWRGRSARRYVTTVHDLDYADAFVTARGHYPVIFAIARDPETGIAWPVDVTRDCCPRNAQRWLAAVTLAGASELHVHLLAESEGEAEAIVMDTCGPYPIRP